MKVINIIFTNFYGEINAANNRINSFIKILLENGYKVNIFSNSKNINGIKEKGNLSIFYIKQKKLCKNNFLKRAIYEIFISYKLIKSSQKVIADYTLITIPSMFLIPLVFLLKNKKIVDIRDMQWEYLSDNIIKKFLKFIMINSMKKYNHVIVTNNSENEYLKKKGIESSIIANGIEKEKYYKIISLDYKMNKEVTYIGNIGIAQNIMTLVKVAEKLPDITFNIIGDGVEFKKIKNYVLKNNIKNVNLTGLIQWDEILKYYEKSKILFAQLKDEFNSAIPSKLYEYASTGLPIIYGGNGEAANFINKLENSYVFKSGDYQESKKLILDIINREIKISQKNRKFIEKNFIREKNSKKLIEILKNL